MMCPRWVGRVEWERNQCGPVVYIGGKALNVSLYVERLLSGENSQYLCPAVYFGRRTLNHPQLNTSSHELERSRHIFMAPSCHVGQGRLSQGLGVLQGAPG